MAKVMTLDYDGLKLTHFQSFILMQLDHTWLILYNPANLTCFHSFQWFVIVYHDQPHFFFTAVKMQTRHTYCTCVFCFFLLFSCFSFVFWPTTEGENSSGFHLGERCCLPLMLCHHSLCCGFCRSPVSWRPVWLVSLPIDTSEQMKPINRQTAWLCSVVLLSSTLNFWTKWNNLGRIQRLYNL